MSEQGKVKKSFYEQNLKNHISDLKNAIKENRKVIVQEVENEHLSEDKYVNVIKARRMASEDNMYYYKEIDRLERELNGENEKQEELPKEGATPVNRRSKK